ncbi:MULTISPECIES: hypothetical protein [Pseudomonas]|uniref:Uncharacterized protein n=1 Tax=Pseudomonas sp. Hg7Tf TaxID=3236988 RepID=A0AB39I016_9PSED|nr:MULTISPECIES: hypothetical protein [Pseudomonas]MDD1976428.1 hypothetical protein [Pseudomonas putida]MDH2560942.1 hypothetical protein [Pseudomonas sp. Hg5Tf]QYX46774.1 hypothetical protein K3F43_19035 [Pseudomonas sp. S11A 273]
MSGLREERRLGMVLALGIANLWTAQVSVGTGLAGDEIAAVSGMARRLHRWQVQFPRGVKPVR